MGIADGRSGVLMALAGALTAGLSLCGCGCDHRQHSGDPSEQSASGTSPDASMAGNSSGGSGGRGGRNTDDPRDAAIDETIDAAAPQLACITPAVGPSPLRRLSHFEYDNSVRDLLGDAAATKAAFVPDPAAGLFDNAIESQAVLEPLAEQYLEAAVTLAESADLDAVIGCDPSVGDCMRDFIARFGRRAYRRPLHAAEADALLARFDVASTAADAQIGARAVIAALLASPKFLFRPESGAGPSALPDAKELTPFELAARLASLLWASLPDDELLDAAASGELATKEQVEAYARRMLMDDRAQRAQAAFYEQWLGLSRLSTVSKDPDLYPSFDGALRAAMAEETRAFVDHVLWHDDARLQTLLTARYSFVNAPLSELYGLASPATDALTMTALDPSERAGLITQASLLSALSGPHQSSPVLRGVWIRVRLLCQDLPSAPPEVPALAPVQDGVSNRERLSMLTASPACTSCHKLIDGLGFGLEHYDAIGAYRETDQGVPVDASGEITGTVDINGPFYGAPELAARLGDSVQVRDCAASQWLRYALGRREGADDACSLVGLQEAFAASDGNLQELIVALTQTDAFWSYREDH